MPGLVLNSLHPLSYLIMRWLNKAQHPNPQLIIILDLFFGLEY